MQTPPTIHLAPGARPQAAARIHQSWARCADLDPALLADPNPLPRADLDLRREAHRHLLRAAEPSLGALGTLADSAHSVVLLADPSGLILHERGSRSFQDKARRVALQPGVSWAEPLRGTNAIGTALHDGRAVRIHGAEHFLACNSILSCHAAPIFSATGEILGILDLSGPADDMRDTMLALVQRMARGIADQILGESPLRRLDFRLGRGPEDDGHALLLLDDDARIAGANEAALRALDADWGRLIGTPCAQWIDGPLRSRDAPLHRHDGQPLTGRLIGPPPAPARPAPAPPATARPPAPAPVRPTARPLPEPDAVSSPLLDQAVRALDTGLAVLLCGETGTGKEVLSRHIHARSVWRTGPFVAINCAALPEHLVESELFGYEPGAFTGARREGARGLLRQAQGGVLFLDEIGDMPLALQTRLLRVLQEREVQPLGSDKRVPLEFGLISASHQDLKSLVAQGRFRADLYYRLQDMPLQLPPLRARPDLAAFIGDAYRALEGHLAGDALAALARHDWPGNYRELFSVLRRLRCQHPGPAPVAARDLPGDIAPPACAPAGPDGIGPGGIGADGIGPIALADAFRGGAPAARTGAGIGTGLSDTDTGATPPAAGLRALERQAIEQALRACQGNVSRAARRLGIHRSTLYRKLKG
ncbi:putative sigma-54-dependent transcriptional regulator [Castellaniella defragrans 65Phen]|uniref:Putative sigma-54-dependent transcriptional regulator n=1 Tax=Castellaniella defragrans (strain DSM 12143 / CCUG 39792 / 65Phen) TaxID=1437824 RepID=W8X938_CASD6|nr:sigma-54-dependent Fis family transcriptional regulator [Castellaniella defragrans]CDM24150.1 putative sigma-54-dependent transcriptional regulator [Castellaniella defragrans 65Phen]